MPKRLTLHIGAPKTGTTSIQAFLRDNAGLLRGAGLLYPTAELHPIYGEEPHHYPLVYALTGANDHRFEESRDEARDIISRTTREALDTPDVEHLLYSHEMLYNAWDKVDVAYLRQLVGDADIQVLIYARRLDEWNESLYRQLVWGRIQPGQSTSLNQAIPRVERTQHLRYVHRRMVSAVVHFYAEALPRAEIVIRPYSTVRGDALPDFLATVGVGSQDVLSRAQNAKRWNNPRPEPAGFLLWHLQRVNFPAQDTLTIARAALRLTSAGSAPPGFEGRRFRFLSDEAARQCFELYMLDTRAFDALAVDREMSFADLHDAERELNDDDIDRLLTWLAPEVPEDVLTEARATLALRKEVGDVPGLTREMLEKSVSVLLKEVERARQFKGMELKHFENHADKICLNMARSMKWREQ
jgi:hypothetical protein